MPKFLIIRFSSIGDIVLTTPVIRCLKKQVKDAEVHFLTKKSFAEIIEHNPYIDKKIYFDNNLSQTIQTLKLSNYDYIIDLHHNLRTFLIKLRLMKKSFSFNKLNFEKWLMVNFKINRLPNSHIVDRYLETVKSFGVINDGEGLDYFLPCDINPNFDLPEKYIAFVIGAKHYTKKLPVEKIISIIRKINQPVVLVGGREDTKSGEQIKSEIRNPKSEIINSCGQCSITQSASIIKNASAVITHDTGMMHIAAAFKKKIISIWGNTIPEFGMQPYYGNEIPNLKFEIRNLKCRPCTKIGFDKCPKGHFKCMMEINELEIAKAASEI
ncbi:MAG: glycosyltransferase family 9 protein [Bacteroidia bacterium]